MIWTDWGLRGGLLVQEMRTALGAPQGPSLGDFRVPSVNELLNEFGKISPDSVVAEGIRTNLGPPPTDPSMLYTVRAPEGDPLHLFKETEVNIFRLKYAAASKMDFEAMLAELSILARRALGLPQNECPVFRIGDSEKFHAHCGLQVGAPARCELSAGLFWALDDLSGSIACIPDTFPEIPMNIEETWAFNYFKQPTCVPEYRFYDYSGIIDFRFDDEGRSIGGFPIGVTIYFQDVPFQANRSALAQMLLRVKILWIMLHEAAHYAGGHLQYFREAFNLDEHRCRIDEVTQQEAHPNRTFEFMADRFATSALIRILTNRDVRATLPWPFQSVASVLRLAATAISGVIFVFAKAHSSYGSTSSHPTFRARLATAFNEIHQSGPRLRAAGLDVTDDEMDAVVKAAFEDLLRTTQKATNGIKFVSEAASHDFEQLRGNPATADIAVKAMERFAFYDAEDAAAGSAVCRINSWLELRRADGIGIPHDDEYYLTLVQWLKSMDRGTLQVIHSNSQYRDVRFDVFEERHRRWANEYADLYLDQQRAGLLVARHRLNWGP